MEDLFLKLQEIVKNIATNLDANVLLQNVESKAAQDYVTELDITLQNNLSKQLKTILPNATIYGEENLSQAVTISEEAIIMDPLDGTFNAIGQIPFYGISLAYLKKQEPLIAITYDLANNEIFAALRGSGMFINGQKITSKHDAKPKKAIALSSEFLEKSALQKPEIILEIRKTARIRMLGSQALQLAYVACGRLRSNINLEAKYWDDIAGYVMLKEMGYKYCDFKGNKIFPKNQLDPQENLCSIAYHPDDELDLIKLTQDLND